MSDEKQVVLVILASENGRDHWYPVKPEAVPAWIKNPETIGRIVSGEACMKCDEGDDGSLWYRAATEDEIVDAAIMRWAQEKRARRALH